MHEAVKEAVGIECANCHSCAYLGSDCDGGEPEYSQSWPTCDKFERYQYLKPFPFATEQKCWEPEFWYSKHTDLIDGSGSNESVLKAIDKFVIARDTAKQQGGDA